MLTAPLPLITNSKHQLTFAGLDLTGRTEYAVGPSGLDVVTFTALAANATFGDPQPIDRAIENSGLLDGSPTYTDSYGNRTPSFQVWVLARNSAALAYGGLLLDQACGESTTLEWVPPDGWGAKTVFKAWTAHTTQNFDDLDELQCVRSYTLTLTCDPFGYSAAEVVDYASMAPPANPKTTVISDGTNPTNWLSGADGTGPAVTSSGGKLVVPNNGPGNQSTVAGKTNSVFEIYASYAPTGGIDLSQTPYIAMDLSPQYASQYTPGMAGTNYYLSLSSNSATLQMVDISTNSDGSLHVVWKATDTFATRIRLQAEWQVMTSAGQSPMAGQLIDNVTLSNVPPTPATATGRESTRILSIQGSARTPGALEVTHPSQPLGDVIVYTASALASGYSPNMRVWESDSAGVTTDATTVTGKLSQGVAFSFSVPITVLPPGSYLLMVRARDLSSTPRRMAWATATRVGTSSPVTFPGQSGPGAMLTSALSLVPLGVTALPSKGLGGTSSASGQVVINLTVPAANDNQNVSVDELWAFRLDGDAALTVTHAGGTSSSDVPKLGSANSCLFVDGPTVASQGTRRVYAGTATDRSDSVDWAAQTDADDARFFNPGTSGIFVVTTIAANPTVGVRHTPAHLHFAAS